MTPPLLTVIPYCHKDTEQTQYVLNWMAELEPKLNHSCLLVADSGVPRVTITDLQASARKIFQYAETMIVNVPESKQGWGTATKVMFEFAANQINECYRLPWFWFEPDCVPLKKGWLDALASAYAESPKRYMGYRVPKEELAQGQPHMAGPGIYPASAYPELKLYLQQGDHFDLAIAPYVLPRMVHTPLIHHFWGKQDLAPVFKEQKDGAENTIVLEQIRPQAVLWHRCKDGSLIDLLRKKSDMQSMKEDLKLAPEMPKRKPPLVPANPFR